MIEVLVSILLFSLGALVVMSMTMTSFRTNDHARSLDCGTNLGRATMDWLLTLDYDHVNLDDVNLNGSAGLLDTDAAADYDHTAVSFPFTDASTYDPGGDDPCFDFTRQQVYWNIARNSPVELVKTISVIVNKQTPSGNKKIVFQTIRAE